MPQYDRRLVLIEQGNRVIIIGLGDVLSSEFYQNAAGITDSFVREASVLASHR